MVSTAVNAIVSSAWTGAERTAIGLGIAGLIVSLAGFSIAIHQIRKTKSAADAAAKAAHQTARALVQNHLLFLIPELARYGADAEAAVNAGEALQVSEALTNWRYGATRARGLLRARGDLPRNLASAFSGAFSTVTETKVRLREPGANVADSAEAALRALDKVMDEIGDLGGQFLGDPQGGE